jgi:Ca-activated chloride channel family protein
VSCLDHARFLLALLLASPLLDAGPSRAAAATDALRGVDSETPRMVLVLDASGSMALPTAGGTSRMAAAKRALTQVVGRLPDDSEVGLRVYGATVFSKDQRGACTDSQLVVPPGTDNRQDLRTAIRQFRPYGETPIAHALRQAARDVGSAGKRSVVLVSDGLATCAPDPCKVAAELTSSGVDLQIDVVGLDVSGVARSRLRCIAERGRGTYYNVDSAREIAATLSRVSQRAARPFTLSGTPVAGARTIASAPTLAQGQWTDRIGGVGSPEAVRYYRLQRTIPGSTIHVTATTRGTLDEWDELEVTLIGPLGTECAEEDNHRDIDQYAIISTQVSTGRDDPFAADDCWRYDKLAVRVERGNLADSGAAAFSLTVFEEPPVTGVEDLPERQPVKAYVAPSVVGEPKPVVPGTSFADAPRLGTGRYGLDIMPGESQIFRVPLDWGQQFTVRARFPAGTPGVEGITGGQGPFGDIKMYSSLLGTLSGSSIGNHATTIMPGSSAGELAAMSPVVRYRNRESSGLAQALLPGDHYVAISMNADPGGDTWVQPYTLEVEVLGERAGVPTYQGGAEVTQPLETLAVADGRTRIPAADRAVDGDEAASARAEDDSIGLAVPGVIGLGVLVLVGLVLALAFARRDRGPA